MIQLKQAFKFVVIAFWITHTKISATEGLLGSLISDVKQPDGFKSTGIDPSIDKDLGDYLKNIRVSISEINSKGDAYIGFEETNDQIFNSHELEDVNLLISIEYNSFDGFKTVKKRIRRNIQAHSLVESKILLKLIKANSRVDAECKLIRNGFVGLSVRQIYLECEYTKTSIQTFANITSVSVNKARQGENFIEIKLLYTLAKPDNYCTEYTVELRIIYPYLNLVDRANNRKLIIPKNQLEMQRELTLDVIPCTEGQIVLYTSCRSPRPLTGQSSAQNFHFSGLNFLKQSPESFQYSTSTKGDQDYMQLHHTKFFGPRCRGITVNVNIEDDEGYTQTVNNIALTGRLTEFKISPDTIIRGVSVEIEDLAEGTEPYKEFIVKKHIPEKSIELPMLTKDDVLSLINLTIDLNAKPILSHTISVDIGDDKTYSQQLSEENVPVAPNEASEKSTKNNVLSFMTVIAIGIALLALMVGLFYFQSRSKKTLQIGDDEYRGSEAKKELDGSASVRFIDDPQASAFKDIRKLKQDSLNKKVESQKKKLYSYNKCKEVLENMKIEATISQSKPEKTNSEMTAEYNAISSLKFDKTFSKDAFLSPHNREKIRTSEIFCYDHSRVELKGGSNDFIHANFISDIPGNERFIITQAPKDETVNDFWQMAFEQNVCLIISIMTDYEEVQQKVNYVPETNKPTLYGQIEVNTDESKQELFFSTLKIKLRNKITGDQTNLTCLKIKDWPDHMYPKHACLISPAAKRIKLILNETGNEKKPAIAHCIAGIGRSGSIVSIRCLMDELEKENSAECNPAAFILFANQWRHKFNMSFEPFRFVQKFMRNHMTSKTFQLSKWNSLLEFDWQNLRPNKKEYDDEISEQESEFAKDFYDFISVTDQDLSQGNETKKQRIKENAPYSSYSFAVNTLLSHNGTNGDFINASFIPGLEPNEFILTQNPLPTTVEDFWNMVLRHKLKHIIFLGDESHPEFIPSAETNSIMLTDFSRIDLLNSNKNGNSSTYKCKITSNVNYNKDHLPISFETSILAMRNWTLKSSSTEEGKKMLSKFFNMWKSSFKTPEKTPLLIIDELGSAKAIQISLLITILRVKKRIGSDSSSSIFDLANYMQILSLHRPGCFGTYEDFSKILKSIGYCIQNNL